MILSILQADRSYFLSAVPREKQEKWPLDGELGMLTLQSIFWGITYQMRQSRQEQLWDEELEEEK